MAKKTAPARAKRAAPRRVAKVAYDEDTAFGLLANAHGRTFDDADYTSRRNAAAERLIGEARKVAQRAGWELGVDERERKVVKGPGGRNAWMTIDSQNVYVVPVVADSDPPLPPPVALTYDVVRDAWVGKENGKDALVVLAEALVGALRRG